MNSGTALQGLHSARISASGVIVVDPRVHDHPARGVIAKEQPVLLEEPGPEPMLVFVTEPPTLAVLRSRRVLRHDIEHETSGITTTTPSQTTSSFFT